MRFHDDYLPTLTALHAVLLAQAPRGMTPRAREQMERKGPEAFDTGFCSAYVEFERAGTNVTLDIKLDEASSYRFGEPAKDKEGNEWREYEIKTSVNWPCHGSCDPATAIARLALYSDVALFAAEIAAQFGRKFQKMTATAAEVAERKAKQAAHEQQRKAEACVAANSKGLRPGQIRKAEFLNPIEEGVYEVTVSGRQYRLTVREGVNTSTVERLPDVSVEVAS